MLRTAIAREQRARVLERLVELLPASAPGIDPNEAQARLDLWSPVFVRRLLRGLEAQGRVASTLVPFRGNVERRRLYYRHAA